jgi:hypothetical protein
MDPAAAYLLVHDELNLDGNPALNLASFVTSWAEPEAERLAAEVLGKNMIDQDEYPQTEAIHERVVSMVGRLFHAPHDATPGPRRSAPRRRSCSRCSPTARAGATAARPRASRTTDRTS